MLGKQNMTQSKVLNNTYTRSWDVGTLSIVYDVIRLVLMDQIRSGVCGIGNGI